jgi:hypothetical protein
LFDFCTSFHLVTILSPPADSERKKEQSPLQDRQAKTSAAKERSFAPGELVSASNTSPPFDSAQIKTTDHAWEMNVRSWMNLPEHSASGGICPISTQASGRHPDSEDISLSASRIRTPQTPQQALRSSVTQLRIPVAFPVLANIRLLVRPQRGA